MGIPKQNRELKYILKDTEKFADLLNRIKKIKEIEQAKEYQEGYLRRQELEGQVSKELYIAKREILGSYFEPELSKSRTVNSQRHTKTASMTQLPLGYRKNACHTAQKWYPKVARSTSRNKKRVQRCFSASISLKAMKKRTNSMTRAQFIDRLNMNINLQ